MKSGITNADTISMHGAIRSHTKSKNALHAWSSFLCERFLA
jgi:hypothetical protein